MTSSRTQILPAVTVLPPVAAERRHSPEGAYGTYRDCIRGDFGFTCPFCLLHESDLTSLGVEGLALTWIEHLLLKSTEGEADRYGNCVYACQMCNRARGRTASVCSDGAQLLDPTGVGWADHFERQDDRLSPRPGDADAGYTWLAYDIDDARKVHARARRRQDVEQAWELHAIDSRNLQRIDEALETLPH